MTIKDLKLLRDLLEEAAQTLEEQANQKFEKNEPSKARAYLAKAELLDRAYNVVGYIIGE